MCMYICMYSMFLKLYFFIFTNLYDCWDQILLSCNMQLMMWCTRKLLGNLYQCKHTYVCAIVVLMIMYSFNESKTRYYCRWLLMASYFLSILNLLFGCSWALYIWNKNSTVCCLFYLLNNEDASFYTSFMIQYFLRITSIIFLLKNCVYEELLLFMVGYKNILSIFFIKFEFWLYRWLIFYNLQKHEWYFFKI